MMKTFKINNEFKVLIDALDITEYSYLESNILENGIRDPLVIWNGTIIDGHNRYEIAQKHNLDFQTVEYQFKDEEEVKIWIIKNQFGKRNLTTAKKIELALLLEPLIQAKAKENQGTRNDIQQKSAESLKPTETRQEIAKLAGVSHDTVNKYKKLKVEAPPELMEKVKKGEVKINTAYQQIQKGTKVCSTCG